MFDGLQRRLSIFSFKELGFKFYLNKEVTAVSPSTEIILSRDCYSFINENELIEILL
jgi:hypothetical protein